jgi:hypothetical protein
VPAAGPVRLRPPAARMRTRMRRAPASFADSAGDNSLGRAANRYVSLQIVSAVVGGILFLIVVIVLLSQSSSGGSDDTGPGTTICTVPDPNC